MYLDTVYVFHQISARSDFKYGCQAAILENKLRAATLLNSLSKEYERLIYNNILEHLEGNNLLYERQSGFLPGHDTQKQLLDIVHMIHSNDEAQMLTSGIFLDVAGAFDAVPHFLLMHKLKSYGIREIFFYL
jgi:hypothetical protein